MSRPLASLFVLLVASAAAPAAPRLKSDERKDQEAAVALVERLGGGVCYDYQRPDPARPSNYNPTARPADPAAFHRVVCVGLRKTRVADDDLKALARLPALDELDLTDTGVTSAGLAHLKGLTGMRALWLQGTQVDDAGLEHLKGMTRMWGLALNGTRVTDRGLAHLAGMTNLEQQLGLQGTGVTDAGLKHLEGMTKLQLLEIRKTKVTAAGVRALQAKLKEAYIGFDR